MSTYKNRVTQQHESLRTEIMDLITVYNKGLVTDGEIPVHHNINSFVEYENKLIGLGEPKKEHTESYQLKRAADAAEKMADKVVGIDFGAVSTRLAWADGREIEIPSAPLVPSQEDFDKLVKRVEALEGPKPGFYYNGSKIV